MKMNETTTMCWKIFIVRIFQHDSPIATTGSDFSFAFGFFFSYRISESNAVAGRMGNIHRLDAIIVWILKVENLFGDFCQVKKIS
jgi:hypothetical protein